MASDELNAPLGQDKRKGRCRSCRPPRPQILAGVLGLFGIVVVAWALFVNDPLGGEPIAVVATGSPAKTPAKPAATASSIPATTGHQPDKAPSAKVGHTRRRPAAAGQQDHHHHRRLQRQAAGRRSIPGKSSGDAPKPPVDQRLLETYPPRRHPEDRAGRRAAVRRSTRIRASCRRARPTRRASPSSSAGSASARPAPPTRCRNCRRR